MAFYVPDAAVLEPQLLDMPPRRPRTGSSAWPPPRLPCGKRRKGTFWGYLACMGMKNSHLLIPKRGRPCRSRNDIKCQAHAAEHETAQERIERVRAAAAVQIAHVYADQPTKWTLIAEAMHWVLVRLERLLDHAEFLS